MLHLLCDTEQLITIDVSVLNISDEIENHSGLRFPKAVSNGR